MEVLEENKDIWACRLSVCGVEKKYRDRGAGSFQFVDVTSDPAAAPKPGS
jgi:hypothetical protein